MTFAFDFDDTITAHPKFFTELGRQLLAGGNRVYILSGRTMAQLTTNPLPDQKDTIPSISTIYGENWYSSVLSWDLRTPEEDADTQVSNQEKIGKFKQRICQQYKIDMLYDDQAPLISTLGKAKVIAITPEMIPPELSA